MNNKASSDADRDKHQDELRLLLKRAEKGDLSVLEELRTALDGDARIWQQYGDLGAHATGSLIQLAAGSNLLMAESLLRKMKTLKEELGGESPSPLERLLIERVTATWLQISYHDALVTQARNAEEPRLKMLERQRDDAHRRHLTALRTFATVKKLLTPALSPIEIATRLDRGGTVPRGGRMGVAGKVPVTN